MSPLSVENDDRPGFALPWHAEAYALAQVLQDAGILDRKTWHHTFGRHLRAADDAGRPDDEATYYGALADALVEALSAGDALADAEISARIDDWRRAYEQTPHGQPVMLRAGRNED